MTNKEITAVALKVFAIYVLIQTMLSIPVFVRFITSDFLNKANETPYIPIATSIIACTLLVVISVLIWKLSTSTANQVSTTSQTHTNNGLSEEFILSVVGFYLCFEGLQSFLYVSTSAYTQLYSEYLPNEVSPETLAYLFGWFAQMVIGVSLILRAQGWASVLRSLREAGLSAKTSNK